MTIDFGGLANSEQNISWKIEANIDQGFEDAKAEAIFEGKHNWKRKKSQKRWKKLNEDLKENSSSSGAPPAIIGC